MELSEKHRVDFAGRSSGRIHWSAGVTYREDRTGIISARRARDEEMRIHGV